MSIRQLLHRLYRPMSPSLRAELKWTLGAAKEVLRKARCWTWVRTELQPAGRTHRVLYMGAASHQEAVALHLSGTAARPFDDAGPVVVSEFPLPGALRVPRFVQPVVPLSASLDAILDGYGDKLRRVVRQQLARVSVHRADSPALVAFANEEMLRPYARERYGPGADQLSEHTVNDIAARHDGRLDIVHVGEQPVACHLGFERVRRGKRYWNAIRFGFVDSVFSHPKRLHEINSVNVFLATRYAKENGYDFYGLGDCLGRPDDGLLHWKRRRGGQIDASQCQEWFYVRLPRQGSCEFLWNTPLFSAGLRGANLRLHLGVPAARSDAETIARYREMSFGGLSEVVIHADGPLSKPLRESFEALFSGSGQATRIVERLHLPDVQEPIRALS
jgi:hypothetical protein